MSIKYPDSGVQVGSVLPRGKTDLNLASGANFICALATTFRSSFLLSPLVVSETWLLQLQFGVCALCVRLNLSGP